MEHLTKPCPSRLPIRPKIVAAFAVAAALTAAGALPLTALADDAALQKFAGAYKYSKDKAHGEAIIEKATDEALSQLNTVMKMMIKKAMEMRPGRGFIDSVLIETPAGQVGLKLADLEKVVLKVGKTEEMDRDGRKGKVTHDFKGGKIVQTVAGDDGKIVTTYTLDPDGKTLHRDVLVESERLKKPIKYRLTYLRK